MKKVLFLTILGLVSFAGYSQVTYSIVKETFTRPDTVYLKVDQNNLNILSYHWTLPGGSFKAADLNNDSIQVIYKTPGRYSVQLVVEDEQNNLDTIKKTNFVSAPGIVTKDIVFCKPETLIVKATGGAFYRWYNNNTDSSVTNYSPQTGYYSVLIGKDKDFIVKMKDSIKVTLASMPALVGNNAQNYCKGDSVALVFQNKIAAYTLVKQVYDGVEFFIPDSSTLKTYTKNNPFYIKNNNLYSVSIIDSLNCPWVYKNNLQIGSNAKVAPVFSLDDKYICKGQSTTLSTSLIDNRVEWYFNNQLINTNTTLTNIITPGKYIAKAYDFTNTCFSKDSAIVSYYPTNPEAIKSINYLPGIGYVTAFESNKNNNASNLFNATIRVDSITSSEKTSYGKLPILIDSNKYNTAPQYHIESYNTCREKASTTTVSPVSLSANDDMQTGGKILEWTAYTATKPLTYYVFRGTRPENMQLLGQVAASRLRYTDDDPIASKDAIYAIGVKDDDNTGLNYKDMLFNWQVGYITSNISPEPKSYQRIGVFAYLQNDAPGSTVYFKVIAPKADSVSWELQSFDGKPTIRYGTKTENIYTVNGLYDVKVKTYLNKKFTDSLDLKHFIKISDPVYFANDTIYKQLGNDTLYVNVANSIRNTVAFLSPTSNVEWTMAPQYNARVHYARVSDKALNPTDSLMIWVNPKVGDTTITIGLQGNFIDAYYPKGTVTIIVFDKTNKAPKVIKPLPEQVATVGKTFEPIYLSDYINDDYTQFDLLKFTTNQNPYFTFTVKDGYLYAEQTDGYFTGTTETVLNVADEKGLVLTVPVTFTQPYLIKVPLGKPTVSFSANKTFIEPTQSVTFKTVLSSADSVFWNFGGGKLVSGTAINPTVTFDKAGKYSISLTAKNRVDKVVLTKTNYIIVSALSIGDSTICKGDSVVISVLGQGFTSYSWNTNPVKNTASIKVAPSTKTNYKVTLIKGAAVIADSVTIAIAQQPELGVDTAFCEGSSLRISPGTFTEYYWNGSTSKGLAYFDATSPGSIQVKTVDSKGCVANDSKLIKPLYTKPLVKLGNDTTFCWHQSVTLDAKNVGSTYTWSTGVSTQTIKADTTKTYSVTVTNANKCVNTASRKIAVIVPFVPSIGIVTLSDSEHNLIAWQPDLDKGVKSYNVKRLSTDNNFVTVATINMQDTTRYIDLGTNPVNGQQTYALTTVDLACNNESYKSVAHTSIHLSSTIGSDSIVTLKWTNYIGIKVLKYSIYRAKKGQPLEFYKTVNASAGDSTITVYYDKQSLGRNSKYQIKFALNNDVVLSRLKADSGPFSMSLSNMAESKFVDASITSLNADITTYPNPSYGKFTVDIRTDNAKNFSLELLNALGQKVYESTTGIITEKRVDVDASAFNSGLYLLRIITNEGIEVRKIDITR